MKIINALELKTMTISQIASLIFTDWRANSKSGINYAAKPYLEAMLDLQSIDDMYVADTGRTIVNYFLSNAGAYRGVQAKLIRIELRNRLAIKK